MARSNPIINGHRYSWASIEIEVKGMPYVGITQLSYGSSLEPGEVFGSDSSRMGRTPGTSKHHCSFEMLRREWNHLIAALGDGFGREAFTITVALDERLKTNRDVSDDDVEGLTLDTLYGCRVVDVETGGADGPEALVVQVTVDPDEILYGGGQVSIDLESAPANDLGGTIFWGRTAKGYSGDVVSRNPWDTVRVGGSFLPGKCTVRATPTQVYEQRKISGYDGSALTMRGYQPGPIEVECLVWTPEQWRALDEWIRKWWRKPFKRSPTEEKTVAADLATEERSALMNSPSIEQPAVQLAEEVADPKNRVSYEKARITKDLALSIEHPWLLRMGVKSVVLESVSLPEEGPFPQSRVTQLRFREYVDYDLKKRPVVAKVDASLNEPVKLATVPGETPVKNAIAVETPGTADTKSPVARIPYREGPS